jgi:hypothetical protein
MKIDGEVERAKRKVDMCNEDWKEGIRSYLI